MFNARVVLTSTMYVFVKKARVVLTSTMYVFLKFKVPVLEREYLKDQKAKQEPFGNSQKDKKETAMIARKIANKKIIIRSNTTAPSNQYYISETYDMEIYNNDDYPKEKDHEFFAKMLCEKNYTDLTKVAKAAIRFEVSDAAAPAIATATLIDYQIITQNDRSQIITEKKIFDTKKCISTIISNKHCSEVFQLKVIGVDSKKDKNTLVLILGYDNYAEPIVNRTIKESISD